MGSIITEVSEAQYWKAYIFISVTLAGIVIEDNALHEENAVLGIEVSSSDSTTEVNPEQLYAKLPSSLVADDKSNEVILKQ